MLRIRRPAVAEACYRRAPPWSHASCSVARSYGSSAHRVAEVHDARSHALAQKLKGEIVTRLPSQPDASISTVPANGDVNPYGAAIVPSGFPAGGTLKAGDDRSSASSRSIPSRGWPSAWRSKSPGGGSSRPL